MPEELLRAASRQLELIVKRHEQLEDQMGVELREVCATLFALQRITVATLGTVVRYLESHTAKG